MAESTAAGLGAGVAVGRAEVTVPPGAGRRLAKNTAVLIALRLLIPLLSVALMLVLSRLLGAEGLGRYTLAYGVLMLFNTIGPLGLYAVITREGARAPEALAPMLSAAFALGTACSLLLTALMAVSGYLLGYDDATRQALLVLSLAVLPYTLGNYIEGACVALERIEYIAVATLAEYLLKVGVGVLLLLAGYGLDAVLALAVLGRALGCGVGAGLLRRAGVAFGWSLNPAMLRRLLRLAPTFLAIAVFATLYWRIDILMLSTLRAIDEVGYYGAAWRLLEFAMVVPASLTLALYPQITALIGERDFAALARLARIALRYLFALTLPVAVAGTLLGEELLALLFGEALRPAAPTLCVLIWTLLPYCLVRYHAYVLVAADRQHIDLWLNIGMSLVNVVLNLLLIPRYGPLGAALATLTAIIVYMLIQYLYLFRALPVLACRFAPSTSATAASLAVGGFVWWLNGFSTVAALLLAPPLYLCLLLLFGFFSLSELALLGLDRLAVWLPGPRGRRG